MKKRILTLAAVLTAIPVLGVILILAFQHEGRMSEYILLTVCLVQALTIILSKKALRPFISPDTGILSRMGIKYVPAAYEPGKFRIDEHISGIIIWLGLLAPVLAYMAVQTPKEVCVTVLNFATYTAPSPELLIPAILMPLLSSMSFVFWFETARAAEIFSQGSDRKRYLLRGFADALDTKGCDGAYLKACRGMRA